MENKFIFIMPLFTFTLFSSETILQKNENKEKKTSLVKKTTKPVELEDLLSTNKIQASSLKKTNSIEIDLIKTQTHNIFLNTNNPDKIINNKDSISTQTRSILLNTSITDKTITYEKHWYKPYPSDFKISVNDQEYMSLQNGKPKLHEKVFTIAKNKVKVTYEWALNKFGKLWHTEKKEMEFEIQPDQKELNIQFSWEDDNRIMIDNAKMVMCANLDQTKKTT